MTPEHTAIWGKTLVEDLKNLGFGPEQIAGNTGIRLSVLNLEEPILGFHQLAMLFERAAELTGDDLIGFRHGQKQEYRRLGLIAYVCSSSPTLHKLIKSLSRFERITGDAVESNIARLDEGIVEWHYRAPRSVIRQQYLECEGAFTLDTMRRLTGRNLHPERVEFRLHRAAGDKPMRKFFGCPVNFGSDENRLVLRPADLDLPLLTSDDYLFRLMQRYCEEAIQKARATKPPLVSSIEEVFSKNPMANQGDVARQLGMSVRTLSRKLAAEGTSYTEVLDGYREAMAKSMIDGSEISLTEIAFVLGYADLSSFSTAFRRWVGKTPTEYRDRAG